MTNGGYGSRGEIRIPRRPESLTKLPLLPRQRRWLNMDKIYPGAASPHVNLTYRLRGPLVVDTWLRELLTARRALFTADTVTRWTREFERTLRLAAADPHAGLAGRTPG